jgi:protein TonB
MFESATFDSQGTITTSSRRWSLAAFALNGSILSAMVIFPLIHPEAIPHRFIGIALTPPPATHAPETVQAQHPAASAPASRFLTDLTFRAPRTIPPFIDKSPVGGSSAPPNGNLAMDMPGTGILGGEVFRSAPPQPVQPKLKGPFAISQGIAAGMVLHKVMPVYPAIARAGRMEGTVILHAVISKEGAIENLRVEGGPAMLQKSALDAVAQWRYRPYLLNGSPVEVETTINVVFSLGH